MRFNYSAKISIYFHLSRAKEIFSTFSEIFLNKWMKLKMDEMDEMDEPPLQPG